MIIIIKPRGRLTYQIKNFIILKYIFLATYIYFYPIQTDILLLTNNNQQRNNLNS